MPLGLVASRNQVHERRTDRALQFVVLRKARNSCRSHLRLQIGKLLGVNYYQAGKHKRCLATASNTLHEEIVCNYYWRLTPIMKTGLTEEKQSHESGWNNQLLIMQSLIQSRVRNCSSQPYSYSNFFSGFRCFTCTRGQCFSLELKRKVQGKKCTKENQVQRGLRAPWFWTHFPPNHSCKQQLSEQRKGDFCTQQLEIEKDSLSLSAAADLIPPSCYWEKLRDESTRSETNNCFETTRMFLFS